MSRSSIERAFDWALRIDKPIKDMSYELKVIRKHSGLSLRDVAKKSGVSAATISRMENHGIGGTTVWNLFAVAQALDIKPENLLKQETE